MRILADKDSIGARLWLLVAVCAAVPSFFMLASKNLWWDEILNVIVASQEYSTISFSAVFVFPHAPLYFMLLHCLGMSFACGEFLMRAPSAVFGTLSVLVFFLYCRRAAGLNVAVLGTVMLALSPMRIWYSQEATPHMMAFFFAISANSLFYRCVRKPAPLTFAFWSVMSLLSFYTTNHSLLFLPAQMLFLLLVRRKLPAGFSKFYVIGLAVQFAFYVPQLRNFAHAVNMIHSEFWLPEIDFLAPFYSIGNFFLGYTGTAFAYALACCGFIVTLAVVLRTRELVNVREIFAAFGLFPLLALFVAHHFLDIYIDRHNILFMPAFFMVVAAGMTCLRPERLRVWFAAGFMLVMASSAVNYYRNILPLPVTCCGHYGVHQKKDVEGIARFLRENSRPGDMWASASILMTGLIPYYAGDGRDFYYFSACQNDSDYWAKRLDACRPADRKVQPQLSVTEWSRILYFDSPENEKSALDFLPDRVWLLQSSWERDGSVEENAVCAENILMKRYDRVLSRWIDSVRVGLYEKKRADASLAGGRP